MAAPFRIKRSELPLPQKRAGHMAVTWKMATVIWGGRSPDGTLSNSEVLVHRSGKWIRKLTSGDVPITSHDVRAHIVNDNMFVLHWPTKKLYSLNLNSCIWTKLSPSGQPPRLRRMPSSWVHNRKIYGTQIECWSDGYFQYSKYLFCYNIDDNSWERVCQGGDIPSPRMYPSTIISGKTVFLFGGFDAQLHALNDLYTMDMDRMIWKKVHGNMLGNCRFPQCHKITIMNVLFPQHNSFTQISQSMALLIADGNVTSTNDMWLLNLAKAQEIWRHMDATSSIWTKISGQFNRYGHATVLEPESRSVWVMGGQRGHIGQNPSMISEVLVLPLNPSLQDLAVASVARNTCHQDPRLAPEQLSLDLRGEIEAYRSMVRGQCSCKLEERCSGRYDHLWNKS